MNRLLLIIATITLAGCARPGDHPISPNCTWSEDDHHPLELTRFSDRRHLRFDAATGEDLAIRWADQHFGLRPEYEQQRDECMQTLFEGIAKNHGIEVSVVRQYSRDRDVIVDAAQIFVFGILYMLVAYIFTGRVRQRFGYDESGFWLMTLIMAAGVSLVAVLIASLGSIVIENLMLNSPHLSYRMNRIPFRRHWAMLFVCGFVVFWLMTLLRSRVKLWIDSQPWLRFLPFPVRSRYKF